MSMIMHPSIGTLCSSTKFEWTLYVGRRMRQIIAFDIRSTGVESLNNILTYACTCNATHGIYSRCEHIFIMLFNMSLGFGVYTI